MIYTQMFIYDTKVIERFRGICQELATGNTVYKEINSEVSMTFCTDCCGWNVYFTNQCISTPWSVILTQARRGKSMFIPFINFFF